MKKISLLALISAGIIVAVTGCRKEPLDNLSNDETRIYVTNHDSTVNFNSYKTYSISDSVAVIRNGHSFKESNATDSAYIDAVNTAMQQRGYTKVSSGQAPDLGITVNKIFSTTSGVIDYGDYWGDYGGYWDPSYWGYGGYGYYVPYAYGVYSITEGAISVDILDLKNAPSKNQISVIWTGLIRGESIYDPTLSGTEVQALFNQSTYLKAN